MFHQLTWRVEMTDDQIIERAREAGATHYSPPPLRAVRGVSMTFEQLHAFARLVRNAALEDAAVKCEVTSGHFFATEYDWPYVACADAIRAMKEES